MLQQQPSPTWQRRTHESRAMASAIRERALGYVHATSLASCSRYATCGCCDSARRILNLHTSRKTRSLIVPARLGQARDVKRGYGSGRHIKTIERSPTLPHSPALTHPRTSPHLPLPPPLPYSSTSLPFIRHLSILRESLLRPEPDECWEIWTGLHETLRGEAVGEGVVAMVLGRQAERILQCVNGEEEYGERLWERCLMILDMALVERLSLNTEVLGRTFLAASRILRHPRSNTDSAQSIPSHSPTTTDRLIRIWRQIVSSVGGIAHLSKISPEVRTAWLTIQLLLDHRDRADSHERQGSSSFERRIVEVAHVENALDAVKLLAEHGALEDISTSAIVCKIILTDTSRRATTHVNSAQIAPKTTVDGPVPSAPTSTHTAEHSPREWQEKSRLLDWLSRKGVEVAPEVKERVNRRCGVVQHPEAGFFDPTSTVETGARKLVGDAGSELVSCTAPIVHTRTNSTDRCRPVARRRTVTPSTQIDSQASHIGSLSLLLSSPFDAERFLTGLESSSAFVVDLSRSSEDLASNMTAKRGTNGGASGEPLAEALLAMMLEVHRRISSSSSPGSEISEAASSRIVDVVERYPNALLGFGRDGWSGLILDCLPSGPRADGSETDGSDPSTAPALRIYQAVRNAGLRWTQTVADLDVWDKVNRAAWDSEPVALQLANALLDDAITDGVRLGTGRMMPFVRHAAVQVTDKGGLNRLERILERHKDASGRTPGATLAKELLSTILIETKLPRLADQLSLFTIVKRVFHASPADDLPGLAGTYIASLDLLRIAADTARQNGNHTSRWSDLAYELVIDSVRDGVSLEVERWNAAIELCLFGQSLESYLDSGTGSTPESRRSRVRLARSAAGGKHQPSSASRTKALILYHLLASPPGRRSISTSEETSSSSPGAGGSGGTHKEARTDRTASRSARATAGPNGETVSLFLEDYRRRLKIPDVRRLWDSLGGGMTVSDGVSVRGAGACAGGVGEWLASRSQEVLLVDRGQVEGLAIEDVALTEGDVTVGKVEGKSDQLARIVLRHDPSPSPPDDLPSITASASSSALIPPPASSPCEPSTKPTEPSRTGRTSTTTPEDDTRRDPTRSILRPRLNPEIARRVRADLVRWDGEEGKAWRGPSQDVR